MGAIGTHTPGFLDKLNDLYFQIEKATHDGHDALSLAQVRDMLGLRSSSTAERYLKCLVASGLVRQMSRCSYTITTYKNNYPPIEYRELKKE